MFLRFYVNDDGDVCQGLTSKVYWKKENLAEVVEYINSLHEAIDTLSVFGGLTDSEKHLACVYGQVEDWIKDCHIQLEDLEKGSDEWERCHLNLVMLMEFEGLLVDGCGYEDGFK